MIQGPSVFSASKGLHKVIEPQPGPQRLFLESAADIVVYGGAAGGGKSYALLLEAARHTRLPNYGAVIFRRTMKQVRNKGGLWDESMGLYPYLGGRPRQNILEWIFRSGSTVKFDHLQHEKDKVSWQGSQVPLIAYDELTHFTDSQFFYLLSRSRSSCGIIPYYRATCNADANSWVKVFLAPWVDKKYQGKPAKSGEIRWFIRDDDKLKWVPESTEDAMSVTFVAASVFDNKILLEQNPQYLARLRALNRVDRMRLLYGDWDIVEDGNMFMRAWFHIGGPSFPRNLRLIRYWDQAASEVKEGTDPDFTAGVLMGVEYGPDGPIPPFYVIDVRSLRGTPGQVEKFIRDTALEDKLILGAVEIWMEQEPGSSGVNNIDNYRRRILPDFVFQGDKVTGNQVERVKPLSGATEQAKIRLVAGEWNQRFINQAVAYPGKGHDDEIVAASGAYNLLALGPVASAPVAGGVRAGVQDAVRALPGMGYHDPNRIY